MRENIFSPSKIEENIVFIHFAVKLSQLTAFQVSPKVQLSFAIFCQIY